MNIIQVPRRFSKDHWGGTETVIAETSKRLLKMGHHTEVLCPNILAKQDEEVIDSVKVTRVPYFYPYWGLSPGAEQRLDENAGNLFSFALGKALAEIPDLDLIHLHTNKRVGGICRHAALKRGIPYVVSLHGGVFDVPANEAQGWTSPTSGAFEWGKALGWWVGSRRVFDDAGAIICVGKEEQRQVQARYPDKRVIYLPNGVNPPRFEHGEGACFRQYYDIPEDALLLLMVGRISPQKNQLALAQILPELRRHVPRVHAAFVGHVTDEAYASELQRTVSRLGMEDNVTIVPGLEAASRELVDAYHAADMLLLPSKHEPFGIVILEAWASGLPVIASKVGGIPAVIEDGKDGLLFEADDQIEMFRAIRKLAEQPSLRQSLARTGQRKAREYYSWDSITRRLENIYEEVVHENLVCQ